MMEGMNNVWGMVLGWIIGFFVLVVFILSLVKTVDQNNNPRLIVLIKK
jgi:regulator of protease activity HflC (stomatin/prohibitin superfamily)